MSRLSARPANPPVDDMSNLAILDAIDTMLEGQEGFDEALLISYIDTLDERAPVNEDFDVDESWGRFQALKAISAVPERKRRFWTKPVLLVATLVFLLTFTVTASIYEIDALDGIVAWIGQVFWTGEPSGITILQSPNEEGYWSLKEGLASYDVRDVIPTWIPQRFSMQELDIAQSEIFTELLAEYTADNGDVMFVTVVLNNEQVQTAVEMLPETDDIYVWNGQQYAIVDNNQMLNVFWGTQLYECTLFGQFTREEAIKMIESVGE